MEEYIIKTDNNKQNIINLIKTEYCLNIKSIQNILGVSNEWIRINVKPYVKYINIKKFLKCTELVETGYIYYSKKSFEKWFLLNTIMTRQTIKIDCFDYRKKNVNRKDFEELIDLLNSSKSEKRYNYEIDLVHKLNKKGRLLLDNMLLDTTKRNSTNHIVIDKFIPNIENIVYPNKYTSREKVYREAFKDGYIKVKLGLKKTLFIKENVKKYIYPITIPYKIYIDVLKKE